MNEIEKTGHAVLYSKFKPDISSHCYIIKSNYSTLIGETLTEDLNFLKSANVDFFGFHCNDSGAMASEFPWWLLWFLSSPVVIIILCCIGCRIKSCCRNKTKNETGFQIFMMIIVHYFLPILNLWPSFYIWVDYISNDNLSYSYSETSS